MSDERSKEPLALDSKLKAAAKWAAEKVLAARGLPTEEEQVLEALREREARLKREGDEALELIRELDRLPRAQARLLCRNKKSFHTWGLCETLLRAARAARFENVGDARHLAELGVLVSEKLDPELYGPALVLDLQARALGYLGNALRIGGQYDEAQELLERAAAALEQGTGDPLEQGQLLEFQGTLAWYTRDFYTAARYFDKAIGLYAETKDWHRVGMVLADKAKLLNEAADFEGAVEMAIKAIGLLDVDRDLRFFLAAHVNLAQFLIDDGKAHEARPLVRSVRRVFEKNGQRLSLARLDWIEGQIADILGEPSEAARLLRSARDEFIAQGIGYDAAEVTVELASHYLSNGPPAELQRLAEEILPILPLDDVHEHLAMALVMLKEKCEQQTLTRFFMAELGDFLFECRSDHNRVFRPRAAPADFR